MTNSHDRRTMQYGLVVFNSGIGMVRPLTLYRFTRSAVWNMIFISKKFIIILTIVTLLNIYIMNNIYIYIYFVIAWNRATCDYFEIRPARTADRNSRPYPTQLHIQSWLIYLIFGGPIRLVRKKIWGPVWTPPPQPGGSKIFLFGGIRYRILA